jgi:hypothetical protein
MEGEQSGSHKSGPAKSAPELAARELDIELNSVALSAAGKAALATRDVSDLTGLVKRKRKGSGSLANQANREAASNNLKRKSPEETDEQGPDKRPKISEGIVTT